ncbi:hypothetical protein KW843_22740 [Acidovorax sp. sif1233]|uniref:hypothetical protein n=1 Tax=Acidovorax sp. sif1233 TaxID=2854792 RepID=UPI001C46BC3C|nr:hypothetical protein [Acidovorax sp. sif1233]MBV7457316.1 hypothetical protein [Acidovorax sp. sif1233]
MATINMKGAGNGVQLGNTPWGNFSALRYVVKTSATGAVINSDSLAAIAANDVVNLGHLPAGFRYLDSFVNVIDGMTATVTGDLGFAYKDGVDDAAVPQDADYFGAGLALATAARLRNATVNPSIVLPKDANLMLTVKTAGNNQVSEIEVVIFGIAEGVK